MLVVVARLILWVERSIGERLLNWKLVQQLGSRVRGINSSEFVAERRLVWRGSVETGCSLSELYAGAVLFNDWYASAHILNSLRAATGSQCKSISALVTCSRGRASQTRRAAAFKTLNLYLSDCESAAGTGKCVVFTTSRPLPTGD